MKKGQTYNRIIARELRLNFARITAKFIFKGYTKVGKVMITIIEINI